MKKPQTSLKDSATSKYENNPFFVATTGIDLFFKKAQSIAIAMGILLGLSILSSIPFYFVPQPAAAPAAVDEKTAAAEAAEIEKFGETLMSVPIEAWLAVALGALIVLTIFIAIGIIISGIIDYTSARIARGKTTTLTEALQAVLTNFWGYTWVMVVMAVKIFLWSLLFIIPGLVMAIRYSLSGVVFFDKKLKGNAAVKASADLTKGAFFTTFASHALPNLLTFGYIPLLLTPGTNAVLYRQFDTVGAGKPKAHPLSWLTLIIPLILVVLFGVAIISSILAFVNSTG